MLLVSAVLVAVVLLVPGVGPGTDALSYKNAFERQIYLYILTGVADVASGRNVGILNRILIFGRGSLVPLGSLFRLVVADDQFLQCNLLEYLLQAQAEVGLPTEKSKKSEKDMWNGTYCCR